MALSLILMVAAMPPIAMADEASTDEDQVLAVNDAFYDAYDR